MKNKVKSTDNTPHRLGAVMLISTALIAGCAYTNPQTGKVEVLGPEDDYVIDTTLRAAEVGRKSAEEARIAAEAARYEQKETFETSGQTFQRVREIKTGDHYIVDSEGNRHACTFKSCELTAIQVAGELNNTPKPKPAPATGKAETTDSGSGNSGEG